MKLIELTPVFFPKEQLEDRLKNHAVSVNTYAWQYFSHPSFLTETAEKNTIIIASLQELGFSSGTTLSNIHQALSELGLRPCPFNTGLFLRFAWKDQPVSTSTVLTGTHTAPENAVTVFSEYMETDDMFPKGLYLRNVNGRSWLRGYVCDDSYCFPTASLFAFVGP